MISKFGYDQIKSVPVVDVTNFLNKEGNFKEDCEKIAEALHIFGCVIIKDPRVNDQHNHDFLNLMESYFENRSEKFYKGEHIEDIFPELAYQVGATPEFKERARIHIDQTEKYQGDNKAITPQPPPYDAKWRFFWPIGDRATPRENDNDHNPPRYCPKDIPHFREKMNQWGTMMIDGVFTVAEMAAIGLDLEANTFTQLMNGGEHLLAPTGSDLLRYDVGTVFAGFHYDLNFLTIHGKSRYPGLFIWLRSGEKLSVAVPDGHLLVQAGIQFDLLTGGYITCGFHEVIYTQAVKDKVEIAKQENKSKWRVSSTSFGHLNHKLIIKPLDKFANPDPKYAPQTVYEQVQKELENISLKQVE